MNNRISTGDLDIQIADAVDAFCGQRGHIDLVALGEIGGVMTTIGRKHEPVRTTVAEHMVVADAAGQNVLAVTAMEHVLRSADDCELIIACAAIEEARPKRARRDCCRENIVTTAAIEMIFRRRSHR